jgi:hypothetical protein
MITRLHTSALALVVAAGCAAAQAQPTLDITAAESAELLDSMAPTNAAFVYYQLFLNEDQELMETYVHFNGTDEDDDQHGTTFEHAEQVLVSGQKTLDNFVWASRLPECDFGVQYQQGWSAILPHLGKMRSATRVLEADARRHLGAGDPEKAVERLRAIYDMSRQTNGDQILISSLVSIAMTRIADPLVNEMMESGELTEEGRDALIESLEAFGTDDPFRVRECIRTEGLISIGWIAKQFPDGNAGTKLAEWGILPDGTSKAEIRRLDAMNGSQVLAEAERMIDYYRGVLEAWDEPDAVDKIRAMGTLVEVGGFGELAKGFAAAFDRAHEGDRRAQDGLAEMLDALRTYRPDLLESEEATPEPATR